MIYFIADLFFAAKIAETARQLGVEVKKIDSPYEAGAGDTVIADIEMADLEQLAETAKKTRVIAYVSHVDMAKYGKYKENFTIVTKSQLSKELPLILRK